MPNSRIARLIIAAKRAIDAVYVAQAGSPEPTAAKANTRVVEIIPDSGANLEILDGRDVSEAGIEVDKTKSMGVKGVEGQFSIPSARRKLVFHSRCSTLTAAWMTISV